VVVCCVCDLFVIFVYVFWYGIVYFDFFCVCS